jgi:transcriptional regulator with XRE-family HTH domain
MEKLNLGARLKFIRLQKGLTVRELARKAGCSASFISQLELNQASPTIANFQKICTALKMSLTDMLREESRLQEPVPVPLEAGDHPLAMRWMSARLWHLLPERVPAAFTALQLMIDVGGTTPSRRSRRPINELGIVLSGRVELVVGEKAYKLEPLSGIYFDLGQPHEWRNVGDTVARVVLVHPSIFQLFEQEEEERIWSMQKGSSVARLFREYSATSG